MTRPLQILALIILCAAVLTSTGQCVSLSKQAVTYSNYSYILDMTASISHVYFATTQGIVCYDKTNERWDDPIAIPPDIADITRIWVDTFNEKLIVATTVGYHEYNFFFDTWYTLIEPPEIRNDSKLTAVPENMFPPFGYNYSPDGGIIDAYGRTYEIQRALDDNSGDLWLGTWGEGAARASISNREIELLPFGLLQSRVDAIYRDDDDIWVSGAITTEPRSGVTILNTETTTFSYIESGIKQSFPAVDITSIDGNDRYVFLGTDNGLYKIDKGRQDVVRRVGQRHGLRSDQITSILVKNDSIFVGSDNGLDLLTYGGDSLTGVSNQTFANHIVYDLELIDRDLWIGMDDGAYRLRLDTGLLQRFTDPSNLLFGNVYRIQQHGDDLWFASDEGMVRLNLTTADIQTWSEIQRYRAPRAMAVNDRVAIISSDHGMQMLYYDRKNPIVRELTIQDGLPSSHVHALQMDGDYVWVGTDGGLTYFLWNNPERVD